LNGKGRIVIPGEVREKLGLKRGDTLLLDVRDNEVVLSIFSAEPTIQSVTTDKLKDFLMKE